MSFSQTAKDLREEINLSQKALSQKLGISSAAVGHLEIGRNEPTAGTIIAYAKFFNISADELLGISDDFGARSEQNAGNVMHVAQSSEETRLLDIYRTLSPDMRATLWSLLDTWNPTATHKNKV